MQSTKQSKNMKKISKKKKAGRPRIPREHHYKRVCVSIREETLKELDRERGIVSRGNWIEEQLRKSRELSNQN